MADPEMAAEAKSEKQSYSEVVKGKTKFLTELPLPVEPGKLTSGKETIEHKMVHRCSDSLHPSDDYEIEKLNSDVSICRSRWYPLYVHVPVLWNGDVYMIGIATVEYKQCKLLKYSTSRDSWSNFVMPCNIKERHIFMDEEEHSHKLTTYDSKLLLVTCSGADSESTMSPIKAWEFNVTKSTFKPSPDIIFPLSRTIFARCHVAAASEGKYLIIGGRSRSGDIMQCYLYNGTTWVVCDGPSLNMGSDIQLIIHNGSIFLIERLQYMSLSLIYETSLWSINNDPNPWQLLKSTMQSSVQRGTISNFFILEAHLSLVSYDYDRLTVWRYFVDSESWQEAGSASVSSFSLFMGVCAVRLPDESLMTILDEDYNTTVYKLKPKCSYTQQRQKLVTSLETHEMSPPLHVSTWKDMLSLKPQQQSESKQIQQYKPGMSMALPRTGLSKKQSTELLKVSQSLPMVKQEKTVEEVGHQKVARIAVIFFLLCIMTFTTSKIWSSRAFSLYNPATEELQSAPPGIQFIYLRTHTIIRSPTTQTIALRKFGIQLHFPPNITLEPVLKITIGVSLSGHVTIPNNASLVSAMYYIRVLSKLFQPITVELEHCITILDSSSISGMKFGKAESEKLFTPPYHFEMLPEGNFTVGQSWGTIKMLNFCLLGIFWCNDIPPNIAYLVGVLSYQQRHRKLGSHKIMFLTGRNLAVNKEMVRKEYSEWTQIVQWFSFKFVHESETLTLNISENGDVSGHWKVQAIVSPPKISKSEIDYHNTISCELRASWMNKDEEESEFVYTLSISGIDKHSVTIIIDKRGRNQDYCNAQESCLHHNEIKKFYDLYHAVANVSNWRGLCVNLHVDIGTIDAIARSGETVINKKYMCLESFFNAGNATWEAVIEAVVKYPVNNRRVAQEIAKKQHIDMEF